jgi:predicted HicB family RNase H-like nuclease
MKTLINKRGLRKPRNVLINPDTLHEARVEALRARKSLGQWLEEAINEKIEREQKKLK